MSDDKLSDVFGLTPLDELETEIVENKPADVVAVQEEVLDEIDQAMKDAHDDFVDIRDKIKFMIDKSMDVFESAHMIASTSQNAKDIEAFAKITDSITKTGKELMSMHKDIHSLKPSVPEDVPQQQQANTINNIIFQGSGVDFIEFVKSKTKQAAITDQSNDEE